MKRQVKFTLLDFSQKLSESDDRLGLATEAVSRALHGLRYEGRASFRRNQKSFRRTFAGLEHLLQRRLQMEEKKIFPFMKRHVPRLEFYEPLFLSEHEEFRERLSELGRLSGALDGRTGRPMNALGANELYSKGMYLLCFLKSHLHVESRVLSDSAARDLNEEEKARLARLVRNLH